jgi:hypothetical protein
MTEFIWRSKLFHIEIGIFASTVEEAREHAQILIFPLAAIKLLNQDPTETRPARPMLLYYGDIRK